MEQDMLVTCQTMERKEHQRQLDHRSDDIILRENIMLEILSRLPVKSLLRFMCVCRQWKSLISSRSFRKLHHQRHYSSSPLILTFHCSDYGFEGEYEPGLLFDYILTTFDLYGKVVQQWTLPISSQNLMMMNFAYQSKLVFFVDTFTKRFYSCNPSTRQIFCLPNPPCFSLPDFKHHTSDFGYIPSKDEYIMVHMVDKNPLDTWVCQVLTMSISDDNFQLHYNEWRSIDVTIMLSRVCRSSGVFVCGAFYWMAFDESGNDCILSFDVETEFFSTFGYPQVIQMDQIWDIQLFELKDELCFTKLTEKSLSLEMWKLCSDINNNKSWTPYWNINLQSLGYTEAPESDEFDPKILIPRLEYLEGFNLPCDVLRKLGKLNLEQDKEEDMPVWRVRIHTNLFTL